MSVIPENTMRLAPSPPYTGTVELTPSETISATTTIELTMIDMRAAAGAPRFVIMAAMIGTKSEPTRRS